jgi:hypothetical protein
MGYEVGHEETRGRRADEGPMPHGCLKSVTLILPTRSLEASTLRNDILQMIGV